MAFAIEKNVPMPSGMMGSKVYPFGEMAIGDSFVASGERVQARLASAAYGYGKYHQKKFICRKDGAGVRVWRVS